MNEYDRNIVSLLSKLFTLSLSLSLYRLKAKLCCIKWLLRGLCCQTFFHVTNFLLFFCPFRRAVRSHGGVWAGERKWREFSFVCFLCVYSPDSFSPPRKQNAETISLFFRRGIRRETQVFIFNWRQSRLLIDESPTLLVVNSGYRACFPPFFSREKRGRGQKVITERRMFHYSLQVQSKRREL